MTKKKRELIEILLDNVKPEDWPEDLPYAAQDKCDAAVYVYSGMPDSSSVYNGSWICGPLDCKYITMLDDLCKYWNKTIVHRDEFMKRWNELNHVEVKTPQQLALEKFGTDWHDNEGVQPVDDDVLVDLIMCDGKQKTNYLADDWSWELTKSWFVKKWRIHSDEKESHADHEAKLLACDDGPMASEPVRKSPLSIQIGGDHYTKLAIQPMQYSMKNGLDPLQHTIIKYVTRFRDKAGIEDLEKAKHCIDMLIEFERNKS